jgi:hypothetical protein
LLVTKETRHTDLDTMEIAAVASEIESTSP